MTGRALAAEPAAEDDSAVGGDAEDPARPPPSGKGVVWGVLSDSVTQEPLFDFSVSVVGTPYKALSDIDGRFRLELPPGTYELRVWGELYKPSRVQNLRVTVAEVSHFDVALEPDQASEDVMVIEAEPDRSSAAAQLLLRRDSARVGDAVSAQDIAKSPDKNAADAAKRVVGSTVVDGKYVFVRGLGDRYTSSLLNGAPLPSPEPDKKAVPLDLFPALLLSDLSVVKTFTPDIPGDFAGGSVQIHTRDLPEKPLLSLSLSASLNTESTFANRLTYQGSNTDWLGIDGGARALPSEIPDYKIIRPGKKPDGSDITREEVDLYGRKMNAYMSTRETRNWPNLGGSLVAGDTFDLGSGRKLGTVAALHYGRKFSSRNGEIVRTFDPPDDAGKLGERNDYQADTGLDQVTWGGLASVAYRPGEGDKVTLTALHSRFSDNEARVIYGFNDERASDIADTRLRFVSRSLTFGQLVGEHTLPSMNGAVIGWNASLSLATSDEPDTRETVYVTDPSSGIASWDKGTLSGSHFFGEQNEIAYGAGLDYKQPLGSGEAGPSVKVGAAFERKARELRTRRFRYLSRPGIDPTLFRQSPDELFSDQNIGPNLYLEEYTRPNDAYDAGQTVVAGYAMLDTRLTPELRLILGERVEASSQTIDSFDPFAAADPDNPDANRVQSELATVDLLPSFNVIYRVVPTANIRLSLSRTVARPQLRELSPFAFTDYFGARDVLGNPDLNRTSIYNGDLRFEVFPGQSEVLAVSGFYKQFYDPIEQVILPTSRGIVSYQNAEAARTVGVEIEARKGLGFASDTLRDVTLLGNLTLLSSRVTLDASQSGIQTNNERPLAGQSPYVVNLGVDYTNDDLGLSARALYNVFGPRIVQVGSSGLPDAYEQPAHRVDLTVAKRLGEHFDLKATVENLTDAAVTQTQGNEADSPISNQYKKGVSVGLGVTCHL